MLLIIVLYLIIFQCALNRQVIYKCIITNIDLKKMLQIYAYTLTHTRPKLNLFVKMLVEQVQCYWMTDG